MRFKALFPRRPSAPLVVSFLALFVALGGAGYAATRLPPNSVGNAQLRNGSVGNWKLKFSSVGARKIINGAVGTNQVNSSQVQLRVSEACATGAVKSVGLSGSVACTPTLPSEYGTSAPAVTLGSSSTQIATESLPAGSSYLVLAYPHAVITGNPEQRVEVDCTLSVPSIGNSTATETSDLAFAFPVTATESQAGTIPLAVPVPSSTSAATATVSCSDTATPAKPATKVTVQTTINALQTASNN